VGRFSQAHTMGEIPCWFTSFPPTEKKKKKQDCLGSKLLLLRMSFFHFYCLKYDHFKYIVGSIDTCLQFLSIKVMYCLP